VTEFKRVDIIPSASGGFGEAMRSPVKLTNVRVGK
jgi:hypothetical protein